jgi:hypothetical protein
MIDDPQYIRLGGLDLTNLGFLETLTNMRELRISNTLCVIKKL